MSKGKVVLAGLAVILATLALVLVSGPALAKKPAPDPEPDPDPVIAYRTVSKKGVKKLWVMNADGSNQTMVVDVGKARLSRPDWSPDGTKLVFGSDVQGFGVYVVDLDGTGPTKIIATQILCDPVWSPAPVPGVGSNTHRIAYNDRGSLGPYGTWNDIYIVKPDPDDPARVQLFDTADEMEGRMTWSPTADRLAFAISDNTGDRWGLLDFESGLPYAIDRHGEGMQGYHVFHPDWARTADKIAWHVMISDDDYDRDIFVVDLADRDHPFRLTTGGRLDRFPSWSPDDSEIVLEECQSSSGRTWIVIRNADGSNRRMIHEGGQAPSWR